MRTLVFLLLLANLSLFGYVRLDSLGTGEAVRLSQQVQPDKIKLLTPQQVAALGPAKVASLADVCVEWGPLSDTDRNRALASLEPLDLSRLLSQKKVEVIANYWVYLPPAPSRAVADQRLAELKASGVKDISVDRKRTAAHRHFAGGLPQRGRARRPPRCAAGAGPDQCQARAAHAVGAADGRWWCAIRPRQAMARLKELQSEFPGSDIKIGACDKTGLSAAPAPEAGASIREATTADDIELARALFVEYARWLNVDLCFQGFADELAHAPWRVRVAARAAAARRARTPMHSPASRYGRSQNPASVKSNGFTCSPRAAAKAGAGGSSPRS